MNELYDRARRAASCFIQRKGYELLDTNWAKEGLAGHIDLVAKDEDQDAIVFIDVTITDHGENGFKGSNLSREQFEILAAAWLADSDTQADIAVRFDQIDLIAVGDQSRALLRHHINSLGVAC